MARRPATLGRPAGGLPRYYLDTGWWRHPRFVGLDVAALFVFQATISYSTEHSTDGHVPADPEDLAVALGLRASDVKRALPRLVERGVLAASGHQLVVEGYIDHNPTAAEVEAYSAERSQLGRKGNHVRHHERRGITDPSCEWCHPPGSDPPPDPSGTPDSDRYSDPGSDEESDRQTSLSESHGMGWDGSTSSSTTSSAQRPRSSDEEEDHHDPPTTGSGRVGQAIDLLAQRDLQRRLDAGADIGNRTRYLAACREARQHDHVRQLHQLAWRHRDWTPTQLADAIEPPIATPAPPDEYQPDPDTPDRDDELNVAGAREALRHLHAVTDTEEATTDA